MIGGGGGASSFGDPMAVAGLIAAAGLIVAGASGARAQAPAVPEVFTTPAGDYVPADPPSSWGKYCGLSVSVAALKDSLAVADVDWDAVRGAYVNGDARFPEWPGVQGYAKQAFPGTPYWEANSLYFDDEVWIDTFAQANMDGLLEHHHGHDPDGDHDEDDLEARVELLEKTALDQVSAHLIMGLLQAAADGEEGAWDAAAAVYTGCGDDNTHGATRNALYDRSDRRGLHYGTLQNGDVSLTNAEVMQAFQDGYSPETAAVVQRAVQRTAWQSLLRYAHLMDGHFEYETDYLAHQAEGWAFWRVLEAAVAQEDPERAQLITDVFSMQSGAPVPLEPSNYCYLLKVLEEDLAEDEAFGAFEDAADIDCGGEEDEEDEEDEEEDEGDAEESPAYVEDDFFVDFDSYFSGSSSGGGSYTGGAGAGAGGGASYSGRDDGGDGGGSGGGSRRRSGGGGRRRRPGGDGANDGD